MLFKNFVLPTGVINHNNSRSGFRRSSFYSVQFIWNSLPNCVVDVSTINQFKARLDKFWIHQDVLYDYTADLTGTGDRSVHETNGVQFCVKQMRTLGCLHLRPQMLVELSVDGDADVAVEARTRTDWNKFRQLDRQIDLFIQRL